MSKLLSCYTLYVLNALLGTAKISKSTQTGTPSRDSTGYAMKAEKAGDIMSGKFRRMYVNPTLE